MAVSVLSPREPGLRKRASRDRFSRVLNILLGLLADGTLDCERCRTRFGISLRELQRDLTVLRSLGRDFGFAVSHARGGRVMLERSIGKIAKLGAAQAETAAMLVRIGRALGGPFESEVRSALGDTAGGPGFLDLREPRPSADAQVSATFAVVKDAGAASARLEFSYTTARGGPALRRVEPYLVIARSGRYYLVAFDLARKDWRNFALDAIAPPIRRDGTFTPRKVPERFRREGAVGWIRTGEPLEVTVLVSATVAGAVTACEWQPEQRVERHADGSASIALRFDDPGEAVRWALRFGADATVLAPPAVAALARETAERIAGNYATNPCRDQRVKSRG